MKCRVAKAIESRTIPPMHQVSGLENSSIVALYLSDDRRKQWGAVFSTE